MLCLDPPPSVRLMTPKSSVTGKSITKSKGFAFLEFTAKSGLQQALKLHQSQLDGRMINVELTAGGGGKSESRLAKVRERNKELHEQRASLSSLQICRSRLAQCVFFRKRSWKERRRKVVTLKLVCLTWNALSDTPLPRVSLKHQRRNAPGLYPKKQKYHPRREARRNRQKHLELVSTLYLLAEIRASLLIFLRVSAAYMKIILRKHNVCMSIV
jgi:RNA recognition motif-containing protein